MSKIAFRFTPCRELSAFLAQAHSEADSRGRPAKRRTTSFSFKANGTHSPIEISLEEPGAREPAEDIAYVCSADMAAMLIGPRCFTSNIVLRCAELMLRMFKAWLGKTFADLPEELLDTVTAERCELLSIGAAFYFKFPTESDAYRFKLGLQNTCEILLDCGASYPHKRASSRPRPALVASDSEKRGEFRVQLTHLPLREVFGEARVLIAREWHTFPATLGKEAVEQRKLLAAAIRCIIQIHIEIDVRKTLHFKGEDHRLPSDFRKWNRTDFPANPFEIIWESLRYALWLNHPLANTEEPLTSLVLENDAQREVLDAYLQGKPLSPSSSYFEDDEAFLRMRKNLIRLASVDILIPWPILKLNGLSELSETLTLEDQLLPAQDPMLASHTLTAGTVQAAAEALANTLPELAEDSDKVQETWPWPAALDPARPRVPKRATVIPYKL